MSLYFLAAGGFQVSLSRAGLSFLGLIAETVCKQQWSCGNQNSPEVLTQKLESESSL